MSTKIKNPQEDLEDIIEEASPDERSASPKKEEKEVEALDPQEQVESPEADTGEDETPSNDSKRDKKPSTNQEAKFFKLARDLKRERKKNEEIQSRLDRLENRFVENNQVDLDRSIKKTETDLAKLKEAKYKAVESGRNTDALKFEKAIDESREFLSELRIQQEKIKSQIKKQPDDNERLARERAEELRDEWLERNPWADDDTGKYENIYIAAQQYMHHLTNSGVSASTPKFWKLLEQEMKARYPVLNKNSYVQDDYQERQPARQNSPARPVSVVNGGSRTDGKSSYGLDAAALAMARKLYGNDPDKIRDYAKYVKEHDLQAEQRKKEGRS